MINLRLAKKKSYQGSALILTTLAIAAMTIIALGVAQLVPKDLRQSQALEASLQAEAAAWGGIEHGLLLLRDGQTHNTFFELADNNKHPFGRYIPDALSGLDCMSHRTDDRCRGIDRQLGSLGDFTPYKMSDQTLDTNQGGYSLLIWHRRSNVGNPQAANLNDGLDAFPAINKFPNQANINPTLVRDEVRRLDMQGVNPGSGITVLAESVNRTGEGCDALDPSTKINLIYTWIKSDGTPSVVGGTRNISVDFSSNGLTRVLATPLTLVRPADSSILSLRLLVTNPDENKIKTCFIRYAIKNVVNETADLGFDVIESTGQSAGVRRKIRVLVNRENGRPLNILDFGIICGSDCSGLQ